MNDNISLEVEPHPELDLGAFTAVFSDALGELENPDWLEALLEIEAETPLQRQEETRSAVRDLLRRGGYKPTGRGKPASEYLERAASESRLASINPAVDASNAVSLHSGLPVSIVDLDLAGPPFRVALAGPGERYVFNPSGQEIQVAGLLCLHDAHGPCANAVKDAQRTKTHPETRRALCLVWGTRRLTGQTATAVAWYRELLTRLGAETRDVGLEGETG